VGPSIIVTGLSETFPPLKRPLTVMRGDVVYAAVSAIGVYLYARVGVDPVASVGAPEPSRVTRVVHGLRSATSR
jgi:hypothetical protein